MTQFDWLDDMVDDMDPDADPRPADRPDTPPKDTGGFVVKHLPPAPPVTVPKDDAA